MPGCLNKPASLALAVLLAAGALYVSASSAAAATATATQTPAGRATATRTPLAPKSVKAATGTGKKTSAPSATKLANGTATRLPNKTATNLKGKNATAQPNATGTKVQNKIATAAPNSTATQAHNKAAPRLPTATAAKNATRVQPDANGPDATGVPAATPMAPAPSPTRIALRPSATAVATRPPATSQAPALTATPVPTALAPAATMPPAGGAPQLNIRGNGSMPGYDRSSWKHWVDADRDCQDTRAEVLIAESLEPVTFTSSANCTVLGGRWYDPYTNAVYTVARELDVDHFVPLGDAHSSGGSDWAPDRKQDYANSLADADHLIAVSASANRAKGSRAPDEWKPPNQGYWCEYAYDWIRVKAAWGLSVTQSEWVAVNSMTATCPAGYTYANAASQPAAPAAAPATAVVVVPAPPQPTATAVIVVVPTEVPVVATAVVAPTDVPVAATAVVAPTDMPTPAPAATAVAAGQCAPGQIDVNSAALEDLQRIIHIGATRAQALIALRPFSSVSDLARISGIGNGARLAQIKAENLACVN